MAYNGLTKLGAEYLSKCIANNKSVVFKKVKVGDGDIPIGATGQETTALYSQKKEVEILSKEQVENAVKLTILLNNLDLTQGFYVKEMGIFIEDDGVEKLYWYINKDNPSFLPDKNNPSKHRYNVYCEVSSSESIVVNFTGQGLLADKEYVDDSIKVIENNFNTSLKKKLDKGNVSVEYDTAKKIEDKIKEIIKNSWKIKPKIIRNTTTNTDLNDIYQAGFYISINSSNKFTNKPNDITGAFELTVTGISPDELQYTTQTLKDFATNRIFIRTQVTYASDPIFPAWIKWEEITNKLDKGSYTGDAQSLKNEIDEKQNKTDNTLGTTAKQIVPAINEVIPANNDQMYSKHYFHDLYKNYYGGDFVFEHIYPMSYMGNSELLKTKTHKEIRLLNGSGNTDKPMNSYTLYPDGVIKYRNNINSMDYIFMSQKNIGNTTTLWDNPSGNIVNNQSIVLNDKWDNYERLVIEVYNNEYSRKVDNSQINFETSLIKTNNSDTSNNAENDYAFSYFQKYGYGTIYFRDDKRTLFFGGLSDSITRIRAIYGINKKVGVI